jgi:exodeoxyribonuclease-3
VYSKKNQTQYTSGLAAQNSTLKAAMYVAILTTFLSFLSIALPDRHHRKDRKQNSALWMNFSTSGNADGRRQELVICGDWNIAHKEIDLKNWKSNQKNSGFLPEERAWLTRLLDEQGWVDVYRRLHPDTTGEAYTWWSNRGQAWANNVGWRIDYHVATPGIAAKAHCFHLQRTAFF